MAEIARISADELLERYRAEKEAGRANGHELSTSEDDSLACSCGEWNSASPFAYSDWLGHLAEAGITVDY